MAKNAILLIHGMGNHSSPETDASGNRIHGSFAREFIGVSTNTLQRYEKHRGESIEDHLDVHEYNYNEFFDKMRKEFSDRAKNVKDRLEAISGLYGISFPGDLAGRLAALEADFGNDEFFYTHWLDVIFYTTMLGAKVRVDAGKKIAELVEEYGQNKVHVMAHSLGTAVVHDTLHLLYRPEYDPDDEIPDLSLTNHKLGSVWMVANVSRLVNRFTGLVDPMKSPVKPGDRGCASQFYNIRHELDPFTWLSRFDPANNGSWIPESIYVTAYNNIVTNLVVDPDTHSFPQYMADPKVAEVFLYQMTPFNVSLQEMDAVSEAYSKQAINGAYASLEEAFYDLNVKDIESWRELLQAGQILKSTAEKIKNNL